jgi:hypothetical protein
MPCLKQFSLSYTRNCKDLNTPVQPQKNAIVYLKKSNFKEI